MADAASMSTREAAGKILQHEHGDPRQTVALVVRELMEAEVASQIGAQRYERAETRETQMPHRYSRAQPRGSASMPAYRAQPH